MTEHSSEHHVPTHGEAVETARQTMVTVRVPIWLDTMGRGGLILGVVLLAGVTLLLLGVVSGLLVPLAAAVVIAAIVVPLVDLLERWHVRRWLAAAHWYSCSGWPWSSPSPRSS